MVQLFDIEANNVHLQFMYMPKYLAQFHVVKFIDYYAK